MTRINTDTVAALDTGMPILTLAQLHTLHICTITLNKRMGQVICGAFVDFAHGDSLCRNWNLISDRGLKLSQDALSAEFNP